MRINLGPKEKKERRLGERLGVKGDRCASAKCAAVRRAYPPGVHGNKRQSRLTPFGLQLREKQKARVIYGLAERQFRNYIATAIKKPGDTGLLLCQLLERRLDNVAYRLGFARSRGEARQVVSYGHFLVNGKKLNIPSYQVQIGDVIEVKPKSAANKFFNDIIKSRFSSQTTPQWLTREESILKGRVIALPEENDIPQNFNRKMIIEFYSR